MTQLKTLRYLILVPLFAIALLGPSTAEPDAHSEIRNVFSEYQSAKNSKDGVRVAGLVSQESIRFYEALRTLALYAPESVLKSKRFLIKLNVLQLRHFNSVDDLEKNDGKAVLARMIELGSASGVSKTAGEIGAVQVSGDKALGRLVLQGKDTGYKVVFRRQDGRWKLHLPPLLVLAEKAILMIVGDSDQDDFLVFYLGHTSGNPAAPGIWEPLRTK